MTSDESPAYATAIQERYAEPTPPAGGGGTEPPGPRPAGLAYATVQKTRANNRVVKVETRLVFGTLLSVAAALRDSVVSWCVNTVLLERAHGSDRQRHSRQGRKPYRLAKDWGVQEARSYFSLSSSNFCGCVPTLRQPLGEGR